MKTKKYPIITAMVLWSISSAVWSQNNFEARLAPAPLEALETLEVESVDNSQTLEPSTGITYPPQQTTNTMPTNPTGATIPYGVWPPIPDGSNSPQAQIEELKNYPQLKQE